MIRVLLLLLTLSLGINAVRAQNVTTLVEDTTRQFAAMHWHPDGRIFAVDYYNGRLYRVSLDGTVETITEGWTFLAGGGFDGDDTFYFSAIGHGKLIRLDNDTTFTEVAEGFSQPVMILQDKDDPDLLYLTEYQTHRVTRVNKTTGETALHVVGQGIFGPDAIFYDWQGRMMVANWNNHKIHIVDSTGAVSLFASIPEGGAMGYPILVGDYIYAPSVGSRKIFRIDQQGQVMHIAGSGTVGGADGEGMEATFTAPNGTCASPSGDTLLVSDHHKIRMITDFSDAPTAIYEIPMTQLEASPNPVSSRMKVRWNLPEATTLRYTVHSLDGKQVAQDSARTHPAGAGSLDVDVSALPAGVYYLMLEDDRSRRRAINFVKQ